MRIYCSIFKNIIEYPFICEALLLSVSSRISCIKFHCIHCNIKFSIKNKYQNSSSNTPPILKLNLYIGNRQFIRGFMKFCDLYYGSSVYDCWHCPVAATRRQYDFHNIKSWIAVCDIPSASLRMHIDVYLRDSRSKKTTNTRTHATNPSDR